MSVKHVLLGLALGVSTAGATAADPGQVIQKSLLSLSKDLKVEAVSDTPINGIYQVLLPNGRVVYATEDGKYLLQGYLYRVQPGGELVNLTEETEKVGVADKINRIPTGNMVVFPAQNTKTHITVFTDTDCGYCQKLHAEVPELNRQGVEVRYLAFPRMGPASHGYNTLVSVWCSKDRQAAMNKAKKGDALPAAKCNNPVLDEFRLGQEMGVTGTPFIVLADGRTIPGYQPAPQLAKAALDAQQSLARKGQNDATAKPSAAGATAQVQ